MGRYKDVDARRKQREKEINDLLLRNRKNETEHMVWKAMNLHPKSEPIGVSLVGKLSGVEKYPLTQQTTRTVERYPQQRLDGVAWGNVVRPVENSNAFNRLTEAPDFKNRAATGKMLFRMDEANKQNSKPNS